MSQLFISDSQSIGTSASFLQMSVLISLGINWFNLFAIQGTLKSHLQHHDSKASILWLSAFFIVQLSHPYMTTGNTITLAIWTFVGKVMSLLFNMLSRFVIVFLPRSNHLLISWLQSRSAVILEPKKRKSVTASTFSHSICNEVMETDTMFLVFWMFSFKTLFHCSFTLIKRLFSLTSLSVISYSISSSLSRDGTRVSCIFFFFLHWQADALPLCHVVNPKDFIWYHERLRFSAITPLYLLFGVSYHCTFQFIFIFSSQFNRFFLECLTGMLHWKKFVFM